MTITAPFCSKRIRQKFCIEVGTEKQGANAIGDSYMGALNRAILVGRAGAGWTSVITKAKEKLANFWTVVEFATMVHEDIFMSTLGGVVLKETTKPMEW